MKDKAAFRNFQNESELEDWITSTTKEYNQQKVAPLTGYPYIRKALSQIKFLMENT